MDKRPDINELKDSKTFKDFYYLKDELAEFCRSCKLTSSGSKNELSNRIAYYLDTGNELQTLKKKKQCFKRSTTIKDHDSIGNDFVCSTIAREYFKSYVGKNFSFNVQFQHWLKNNPDKTFLEAIDAYKINTERKKTEKTAISPQFEYNAYIRDFFTDNADLSLSDAITCWKYKKNKSCNHKYDKKDLDAILNRKTN